MNDENASDEWKKQVDGYVEQLCGNYQGVPESAYTCGEYLDKATFGFDLYPFYGTQVWKLSEVSAADEESVKGGSDEDIEKEKPEKPGEKEGFGTATGAVCVVVILAAAGIAFAVYKKKKKQG